MKVYYLLDAQILNLKLKKKNIFLTHCTVQFPCKPFNEGNINTLFLNFTLKSYYA